jgi:hypothetical protein
VEPLRESWGTYPPVPLLCINGWSVAGTGTPHLDVALVNDYPEVQKMLAHLPMLQQFSFWFAKGSGLPMDTDKAKVTISTAPRREL